MLRTHKRKSRRGVEVVEFALTLPLLVIALFGMLEVTHRWHIEKMLKIATHEAMKAGAEPGGTSDDAEAVFAAHTTAMGIQNATLTIGPSESEFDNGVTGQILTLAGEAPQVDNRLGTPSILTTARDLSSGTITYWRESL